LEIFSKLNLRFESSKNSPKESYHQEPLRKNSSQFFLITEKTNPNNTYNLIYKLKWFKKATFSKVVNFHMFKYSKKLLKIPLKTLVFMKFWVHYYTKYAMFEENQMYL